MIYIDDAGHGGTDPGATHDGNIEKVYTLEAAAYVNQRMGELGFDGDVTRDKDVTLSNKDRVDTVKQYKQSTSHHFNAGGGSGLEVICSRYSDGEFERMIVDEFKKAGYPTRFNPVFTRTMRGGYDYYFMHRLTGNCKVSIIEYDFLDGPQSEKIKDKDYRIGMYECVVRALCKYNNIKYKPVVVEEANVLYKILVGDFINKIEVEKALNHLKDLGYNGIVQEEKRGDTMLEYNRPLKLGSRGEDVKLLQVRLNELGYYFGGIDGSFGPIMDKAVRAYQSANSLKDDGSVGPATINVLNGGKKDNLDQYEVIRPNSYTTIVKILRNEIEEVKVILANTKNNVETLSSMKKRSDVDLIISGGLWWVDIKGKAHSLNLLIADGKQSNEGIYSRFGLRTFKDKSYEFAKYRHTPQLYGMLGGSPSLVVDGKINIDTVGMSNSLIFNKHPRAGVGMDDNYFYLVTVDGRVKGKPGMTIREFAALMKEIGCKFSIGGDGGGTVRAEDKDGAINSPLENRPSNNAIGIKLKK